MTEVFQHWTIIKKETDKDKYSLCKCSCGIKKMVYLPNLIKGKTTMCRKCRDRLRRGTGNPNWKGGKIIPKKYWDNLQRANSRRKQPYPFEVSMDYAEKIFENQQGKCAFSKISLCFGQFGTDQQTASLDRIDNNKGYTEGNVQWVHKYINRMKGNMPDDLFIDMCREVANGQEENGKK